MSGFIVQDSIKVLTQNGPCQIDLCLGDITKLRQEDKVDVIMVSAFQNDYIPTRTSLIGALKFNLGVKVGELAQNKAEDLRHLYSCWWSHPLPDEMPYGRLLCFETNHRRMGRPQELVANVYRCLVPILNNEDGTVITPLLNTGDQGYEEKSMLQGMVVAAVNWMKAGLPLRLLKIVIYASVVNETLAHSSMKKFAGIIKTFAKLRERYDSQYLVPKAVPIEFDIYLSYCEEDTGVVSAIQDGLKSVKSDVRIYGNQQEIDSEAVWQQDMYQVMIRSARVITVLSPNYLKSTACVEQYNIALCCNRRAHRDMLAPFYVNSIDLMPTYMGLVQYVDCRPNDNDKIHEACKSLIVSLTIKIHLETLIVDPAPIQYDVFLSYSHRDDKQANHIVKLLQRLHPQLRLFFDIQELKTGKAWQRMLYHSIDGSRCLLALVSENYIKSPVCQEEYNLALAKHCSSDRSLQLVPLCLEELTEVPMTFGQLKMVKATPDVFESVAEAVCKAVVSWLEGKKMHPNVEQILRTNQNHSSNMNQVSEGQRRSNFIAKYGTEDKKLLSVDKQFPAKLKGLIHRPSSAMSKSGDIQEDVDVVFSCAKEDWKYAAFLKAVLKDAAPSLVAKATVKSENERLTLMDTARCMVPFLTPNYLDSPEQVEEFHIALCRQRTSPSTVLFPIMIHPLPQKPTYFHLVSTPVSVTDAMWSELANKWHVDVPSVYHHGGESGGIELPPEVVLGLHEAACLLIDKLMDDTPRSDVKSDGPFSRPVLNNMLKIQKDISETGNPATVVELTEILTTLDINADESVADIKVAESVEEILQENSEQTSPELKEQIDENPKPDTSEKPCIQPCVQDSVETTEEGSPNYKTDVDKLNPRSTGHSEEQSHGSVNKLSPNNESEEKGIDKLNPRSNGDSEEQSPSSVQEPSPKNESEGSEREEETDRMQRAPRSSACQLI